MLGRLPLLSLALVAFSVASCATEHFTWHDPTAEVPQVDVLKSIRCELISFIEVNYYRALQYQALVKAGKLSVAIENYRYLSIDRYQYAGVAVDLKDIDTITATTGLDGKSIPSDSKITNYSQGHFGPSYSQLTTNDNGELFIIPQYASLGPAVPGKDSTLQLYKEYNPQTNQIDSGYFCYHPLQPMPASLLDRVADLNRLAAHSIPDHEAFTRIFVDGKQTLAAWLINESQIVEAGNFASVPQAEFMSPGQVNFNFILEWKPGLDLKYTLIARYINPLVPEFSVVRDHSSSFTIYLNEKDAKLAFGAKTGTAVIDADMEKKIQQIP